MRPTEETYSDKPTTMQEARIEMTMSTGDSMISISCSNQLLYVESIYSSRTHSTTAKEMVSNILRSDVEEDVDCAHKLANSIPFYSVRSDVLASVSDKYVDLMKCVRAIEVAKDIPYSSIRDAQLGRILVHRSCRRL